MCKYCKNEAREIDCLCCRELNVMFIALGKISEGEGTSGHAAFMCNCPTFSHMLALST